MAEYSIKTVMITHAHNPRIPEDMIIFNYGGAIGWASRLLGDSWYGDYTVLKEVTKESLDETIDLLVQQAEYSRKSLKGEPLI